LPSLDFSAFNLGERRPELVRRIKELQPEASNRAIAEAVRVAHITINRDLSDGTNVPHDPGIPLENEDFSETNVPTAPLSEPEDVEGELEDGGEVEDDAEETFEPEDLDDEDDLPAFLVRRSRPIPSRARRIPSPVHHAPRITQSADHHGRQTLKQLFGLPPKAAWTTFASWRHFLPARTQSQTSRARKVQRYLMDAERDSRVNAAGRVAR
jgi:hypothetical protein